jgi:hypothetical protein
MLRRVALVRPNVSEERSTSIIRVRKIADLGKLAITSNRRTLQRNTMWGSYRPPKRRFLQESHCVTPQKTTFFIVTAMKTSNLT